MLFSGLHILFLKQRDGGGDPFADYTLNTIKYFTRRTLTR